MVRFRTRVLVGVARVLGCHLELLEAVTEGTLRFVGTSRVRRCDGPAATGRRRSILAGIRRIFDRRRGDGFPSRHRQSDHRPDASEPPLSGGPGSYVSASPESNRGLP